MVNGAVWGVVDVAETRDNCGKGKRLAESPGVGRSKHKGVVASLRARYGYKMRAVL